MNQLIDWVERFGGALTSPKNAHSTIQITGVQLDSRQVRAGDLFVALPGVTGDGLAYVKQAEANGAVALLLPESVSAGTAPSVPSDLPQWRHAQARKVAGECASLVHGEPSLDLEVVAITGTNGKTTTAHMLRSLLGASDPALLGTTGYHLAGGKDYPASHTTPDAPRLQALMAEHRAAGGGTLIMEASSHALEQDRLAGTQVDLAVFTNLSRDHLDYHGDMESYGRAKARLFETLGHDGAAVLNADDAMYPMMARSVRGAGVRILTTSTQGPADLWASNIEAVERGTRFDLQGLGLNANGIQVPLLGRYNVSNLLQALACARWLGVPESQLLEDLARVKTAPGRMELLAQTGVDRPRIFVDYAHTPEALQNALNTLREVPARGRVFVVFGCGGDRDPGKRALMGGVAAQLADHIIVTNDNPRGEDPEVIAEQILAGVCAAGQMAGASCHMQLDRRAAIQQAVEMAQPEDLILIAGKGHETTQTSAAGVIEFDDRLVAQELCS
ncbi:MAG: UDP-N-acetylmuramoyl-L-alanyl-D-glutamate--2,6-diaminopimelate ligase [Planctomycetes bacterium]|nr:UDP-N-acetylmuramoyl-L-alanyl-D-glutamate--2,6-diaminopimelate ligase [Planctomycetota bacterium]